MFDTPKTLACFRDGMWHADELANLCAKLEKENRRLKFEIEKAFEEGFLKVNFLTEVHRILGKERGM